MERSRREIGSLRKGLRLLRLLNQVDGATAKEMAGGVGINRTTAYRLLETMCRGNYVSKDPYDQRYRATAKVRQLSVAGDEAGWHSDVIVPALGALSQKIPWPLSVSTMEDGEIIVRHTTNADGSMMGRRMPSGSRLPLLGTGAGLLFLAMAPRDVRDALLALALAPRDRESDYLSRFARLHQADRAAIERKLDEVGGTGHALLHTPGSPYYSIVVPLSVGDRMIAALGTRLIERVTPTRKAVADYLPLLRTAAAAMAQAIVRQAPDRRDR